MASLLRIQTADGTWTSLESNRCGKVSILNTSGADLEVRHKGDTDNSILVPDSLSVCVSVVHTSAEVQIKGAGDVQLVID